MDQAIYLITNDDEVYLGTVAEIVHGAVSMSACQGISFAAAISDIVAGILGDPFITSRMFTVELRQQ